MQHHRSLFVSTLFLALGLIASPGLAADEGWTEDHAAAQKDAQASSKDLFLEFTGSDWCPPCIELNKAVFSHDAFTEGATEHFVLVKLDFPSSKPQSEELKAQNEKLAQQYGIEGFPTIVLADAQGRPYAETGFRPGGPEEYLKHLEELKQVRIDRDKHFAAAEKAEGIEKAKHLHEGLQRLGGDLAVAFYQDAVKLVMELDSDNAAGLKSHYEALYKAQKLREKLEAVMDQLQDDGDGEAAVKAIDGILADKELPKAFRQEVLVSKCEVQYSVLEDKAAAKATLQEAIDVDPDSQMALMLKGAMEQLFGGVE